MKTEVIQIKPSSLRNNALLTYNKGTFNGLQANFETFFTINLSWSGTCQLQNAQLKKRTFSFE